MYGNRKLVGLKFIEAFPELKNTDAISRFLHVYETGEPYVGTETRALVSRDEGKEPEPGYFNFSYQPIYDVEKQIEGILIFGYEVTEQILVRNKSEENLKWVLESLPQITSTSSANGTNIFFNKFFFEYSGLSVEEATKEGWNSILHPDEIKNVLSTWERCKEKGTEFCMDIRLRRKIDGMYRWHISHITPMKDHNGKVTQWIASATDIHEQKMKEQKKDEFMSIASHEMKTPLTSVKAYLQLLEMSVDKSNTDALLYTRKAISSVERLKNLISELLDVNKIQHGQLNITFNEFDFNEMVNNAVEDIQYNSPNHKIIKTGRIDQLVYGDKERLQQVIVNLLSNAVKYSPGSHEVSITVGLEEKQIKVAVKDSGIGIANSNLLKIFGRYFRVEGQDFHSQGLGIGLFISMNIIERHNGKLWAESEQGKGSIFYFTIPLFTLS
jgi:PAS domain S-box-containing protein